MGDERVDVILLSCSHFSFYNLTRAGLLRLPAHNSMCLGSLSFLFLCTPGLRIQKPATVVYILYIEEEKPLLNRTRQLLPRSLLRPARL